MNMINTGTELMLDEIRAQLTKDRAENRAFEYLPANQCAGKITALAELSRAGTRASRHARAVEIAALAIRLALDAVSVQEVRDHEKARAAYSPGPRQAIAGRSSQTSHNHPLSRPTLNMVDEAIADEQYHIFPGNFHTVCALTLRNGFTIIGESVCINVGQFNAEIGRDVAKGDARQKAVAFLAYMLREDKSRERQRAEIFHQISEADESKR